MATTHRSAASDEAGADPKRQGWLTTTRGVVGRDFEIVLVVDRFGPADRRQLALIDDHLRALARVVERSAWIRDDE